MNSSLEISPHEKVPKLKLENKLKLRRQLTNLSNEDRFTKSLMQADEKRNSRVPLLGNNDLFVPGQ